MALVKSKIYTIRGQKVMLDFDLAQMYEVETKALNQAVKRNIKRFDGDDFMFRLTKDEATKIVLRSQIVTAKLPLESGNIEDPNRSRSQIVTMKSGRGYNIKYPPYAFTELGVAMLSSVLKSETALSELQTEHRKHPKRKPIGFIQPNDDNNDTQR